MKISVFIGNSCLATRFEMSIMRGLVDMTTSSKELMIAFIFAIRQRSQLGDNVRTITLSHQS